MFLFVKVEVEKVEKRSKNSLTVAQQVERSSALVVGLDQPPRIESLLLLGPVDDAPVGTRAPVGLLLEVGRARASANWPRRPLSRSAAEHGDDSHPKEHAEGVADCSFGGEVAKLLGASPLLEKKKLFFFFFFF